MKNKKKVLFFLPHNVGGAERMTILLASMLPKARFEVAFVVVGRELGDIVKFIPDDAKVIHIPIHNIWCMATLRMARVIKQERADAVFSSLIYLNTRLIVAARMCGAKVVVRNNIEMGKCRNEVNAAKWHLQRALMRVTYRWANHIIAQQEEMQADIAYYARLPMSRITVLHNPINTRLIDEKRKVLSPFTETENSMTKYVSVGRFSHEKGQDLLVKAFKKVYDNNPNARLFFVGKYNWSNTFDSGVKDYVEENGLKDVVRFCGFDENPYRWVANCDCYVMASRLEGLPNALIDAMYLGRPVVATNCIPVVSRIVKDQYNGFLAESNNVDSIADAMTKAPLLRDFEMTYSAAKPKDFFNLFETDMNGFCQRE